MKKWYFVGGIALLLLIWGGIYSQSIINGPYDEEVPSVTGSAIISFYTGEKSEACAMWTSGQKVVMVDTGTVEDALWIADQMQQQKLEVIDALILTGAEEERAGGLETIINRFTVKKIICSGNAENAVLKDGGIAYSVVQDSERFVVDDVLINLLSEDGGRSIFVDIVHGKSHLLLPGQFMDDGYEALIEQLQQAGTNMLLKMTEIPEIDQSLVTGLNPQQVVSRGENQFTGSQEILWYPLNGLSNLVFESNGSTFTLINGEN